MESKTFILFLSLTATIFCSCQKEPLPKPLPEPGYPTTYKPLTGMEWNERNAEFQKINIYGGLNLNEYGFVEGIINLDEEDSIKSEFVIEKVEDIVEHYRNYMGIPENYLIDVKNNITGEDYYLGIDLSREINDFFNLIKELNNSGYSFEDYNFALRQTYIEDSKISGPKLIFQFNLNENVLKIKGNYYPEVFIPKSEIYTLEDAIAITYQFIKNETGIDIWEGKHNFNTMKTFILKQTGSDIEIRECWKIEIFELDGLNFFI